MTGPLQQRREAGKLMGIALRATGRWTLFLSYTHGGRCLWYARPAASGTGLQVIILEALVRSGRSPHTGFTTAA